MGGIYYFVDLQVLGVIVVSDDLGFEGFVVKLVCCLVGFLFIGKDGEEVDGMDVCEVEVVFFYVMQDIYVDII